jgi:preprotein translocase subunit SecY
MIRNTAQSSHFSMFSNSGDLAARVVFVIVCLVVFRIGSYIPLPGVDSKVMSDLATQNSSGVLGMFNMLSGGSLGRMTIFALSIVPYITSSIVIQLLSFVSKTIEEMKKDGEEGRKKINQYTKYLTLILCIFQAYGVAISLESMSTQSGGAVIDPGLFFRLTTVSSLVGGTLFLMWLGEQISYRGIGNGTSLIIFSGIVAGFPSALISIFELGRTGALAPIAIISVILMAGFMVALIVFMERSVRKVIVQYPKRQVGNKIYGGESSHIPLKINTAGVIPPIFAGSLLLFPTTIANFSASSDSAVIGFLASYFNHGKPLYIIFYVAFIVLFSFMYTAIIFNPDETAENLRKYGGIIPGRRPGKNTAEFLDYILTRITLVGSVYLALICAVPEVLISSYSIPFYLGGTSLLIVVNVVLDFMTQIQTHLYSHQYESLLKKVQMRGKK